MRFRELAALLCFRHVSVMAFVSSALHFRFAIDRANASHEKTVSLMHVSA